MYQKEIRDYIIEHKEEFGKELARLCAIEGTNGPEVPGKPYGIGPGDVLDTFLETPLTYGSQTENWD